MEFVWITVSGISATTGFSGNGGFQYSENPGFPGILSATVFETDDYDTRIYIYEPDLLYNFSFPAYYGKGLHYYLNLHRDLSRLIGQSRQSFPFIGLVKMGSDFLSGSVSIGTGLDEIPGNRKSEIKAQVLVQWQ